MIPYGRQDITEEDIKAVVEVLRSDWLTQGPTVGCFEAAVGEYCGARFGVATNSATSALHLACLALDVGEGDHVWTTPISFVASANCARMCGADVDFVDVDPHTWNMSVDALKKKLLDADRGNVLPKVVIPVHFAGLPCEMAEIRALSEQYGFRVIEDASHAVGASYRGEPVGGGRYSDITVFSFHPVKIVTTGEGGIALTNNGHWAERMARLRSHGITRDPSHMEGEAEGPWYYQQTDLGFNYRMTDIQAALGLSQLSRLDAYVSARRRLARRYDQLLAGLPIATPAYSLNANSAFHLYVVRLNAAGQRRQVFERMRAAGIGVNVHYIPIPLQPYYRRLGYKPGDFPDAEACYAGALTLPLFPGLAEADQDYVVAQLRMALEHA